MEMLFVRLLCYQQPDTGNCYARLVTAMCLRGATSRSAAIVCTIFTPFHFMGSGDNLALNQAHMCRTEKSLEVLGNISVCVESAILITGTQLMFVHYQLLHSKYKFFNVRKLHVPA